MGYVHHTCMSLFFFVCLFVCLWANAVISKHRNAFVRCTYKNRQAKADKYFDNIARINSSKTCIISRDAIMAFIHTRYSHSVCVSAIATIATRQWLHAILMISAKWTDWMAKIMFSSDLSLSMCVRAQRTGQSDQFGRWMPIAPNWLKIRNSNLTCMFPFHSQVRKLS